MPQLQTKTMRKPVLLLGQESSRLYRGLWLFCATGLGISRILLGSGGGEESREPMETESRSKPAAQPPKEKPQRPALPAENIPKTDSPQHIEAAAHAQPKSERLPFTPALSLQPDQNIPDEPAALPMEPVGARGDSLVGPVAAPLPEAENMNASGDFSTNDLFAQEIAPSDELGAAELSSDEVEELMRKAIHQLPFLPSSLSLRLKGQAMYDDNLNQRSGQAGPNPGKSPAPVTPAKPVATPPQGSGPVPATAAGPGTPSVPNTQVAASPPVAAKNSTMGQNTANLAKESDIIYSLGAGFSWSPFRADDRRFTLSYDATSKFYMEHDEYNGVDHLASLKGSWDLSRTKLTLNADYSKIGSVEQQSRQFQDQQMGSFSASVHQELTGKLSMDGSGAYHGRRYDTLQSDSGYLGRLGLNWALNAKTRIGIAAVTGATKSDRNAAAAQSPPPAAVAAPAPITTTSPAAASASATAAAPPPAAASAPAAKPASYSPEESSYHSFLLTFAYLAGSKLKFSVDAGLQQGTSDASSTSGDESSFVWNITTHYALEEKTTLDLSVGVGVLNSDVSNAGSVPGSELNYQFGASHRFSEDTSVNLRASQTTPASTLQSSTSTKINALSAGLNQRLSDRLLLSLDAGYQISEYTGRDISNAGDRRDEGWNAQASLGLKLGRNTTCALFYTYRNITSTPDDDLSYQQNTTGISLKITW